MLPVLLLETHFICSHIAWRTITKLRYTEVDIIDQPQPVKMFEIIIVLKNCTANQHIARYTSGHKFLLQCLTKDREIEGF